MERKRGESWSFEFLLSELGKVLEAVKTIGAGAVEDDEEVEGVGGCMDSIEAARRDLTPVAVVGRGGWERGRSL